MRAPTVYRGTVIRFESGRPLVEVPALGVGYVLGPCETTTGIVLAEGARVLCVSVSGIPEDVVVVGELDPAQVVLEVEFTPIETQVLEALNPGGWASLKARFQAIEARATALESRMTSAEGRISAVEGLAHSH